MRLIRLGPGKGRRSTVAVRGLHSRTVCSGGGVAPAVGIPWPCTLTSRSPLNWGLHPSPQLRHRRWLFAGRRVGEGEKGQGLATTPRSTLPPPISNPARRLRDGWWWWWWWCRCLYTLNRCGIRDIHRIQRINDTRRNGVPDARNKAKAGTAHVLATSVVASGLTLGQSPPFQPSGASPPPQFLVVLNLASQGSWELGAGNWGLGTGDWE